MSRVCEVCLSSGKDAFGAWDPMVCHEHYNAALAEVEHLRHPRCVACEWEHEEAQRTT